MKNKLFLAIVIAVVGIFAGYNVYQGQQKVPMSDLAFANVEALATGESSEEFFEKTGCEAVQEDVTCRGKDKKLYSFAKKPN